MTLSCFPEDKVRKKAHIWFKESTDGSHHQGVFVSAYKYFRNRGIVHGVIIPPKSGNSKAETGMPITIVEAFKDVKVVNNEVIELWKKYLPSRLSYFKTSTIHNVVLSLPILRTSEGLQLLHIDFLSSHTDEANEMIDRWPDVAKLIVDYAQERRVRRNQKDIELDSRFKKWESESTDVQALFLLPIVFDASKIPNCKIKKNDIGRCFVEFLEIKNDEDFETTLRESQQTLTQQLGGKNPTLTPRVVLYGENPESAKSYVVLTESIFYGAGSLVQAVDSCFKCIKGLYMISKFGRPIPHVWCFLEKYVYGILNEHDGYKGVDLLITHLDRIREFVPSREAMVSRTE